MSVSRSRKILLAGVAGLTLTAAGAGAWALGADGDDDAVSAADGVTARARATAAQFGDEVPGGAARAITSVSDESLPADCGAVEEYEPTPEEVAAVNADQDALAAALDEAGIGYARSVDDFGFVAIEWEYESSEAQAVVDAFWAERYPTPTPTQEELDRVRADNDVVARHLDEAGIAHTRSTDASGWDVLEWDFEDPAAQQAVDAAYLELYPPQPPNAEDLDAIRTENDRIATAFEAAGISYERVSDELGWEWIEWDWDDPATRAAADAVFAELYPPVELPEPCELVDPVVIDDGATDAPGLAED